MSPIARILVQRGNSVSGSDLQESSVTRSLASLGVAIHRGHQAANVECADVVIASAAIRPDNPELREAAARGIRTVSGAAMLGELMEGKRGICVAGTHGKTTTTAMIALALARAAMDPTYVIGGEPIDLPASGRLGSGEYFVAEADEFGGRFLSLHPWIAVLTSLEPDHPDCYPTMADLLAAFGRFLNLVPPDGWVIACSGSPAIDAVVAQAGRKRISFGLSDGEDWQAAGLRPNEMGGLTFTAEYRGRAQGEVDLRVPGRHNVSNALAALAAATLAGADVGVTSAALASFRGVQRRFEIVGEALGATLVDDYAHHPSEIRATLAGARQRFPGRRIVALHQPHTYSRLKALLPDFAEAFADADQVLIVDIYPSRETDSLGVHASQLAAVMSHPAACYAGTLDDASRLLANTLREGDVLISLGAGDVNTVLHRLIGEDTPGSTGGQ